MFRFLFKDKSKGISSGDSDIVHGHIITSKDEHGRTIYLASGPTYHWYDHESSKRAYVHDAASVAEVQKFLKIGHWYGKKPELIIPAIYSPATGTRVTGGGHPFNTDKIPKVYEPA